MTAKPWQVLSSSVIADYDIFQVIRSVSRSPRDGKEFVFHAVQRPDCVQVVAFTKNDDVVMTEQFRHGVRAVSLEFPAGVLGAGEDPITGALRELQEETGYISKNAKVIGMLHTDPALHTELVAIVLVRECEPTGQREPDAAEDIHVRVLKRDEVDHLIRKGEIRHGLAVAAWYLTLSILS